MDQKDKLCISAMRVLAADAIEKAKSGHPGLPIGAAPMAYALWKQMRHDPKCPSWQGRDRFILSAGHASMLEYSILHLYGYPVSMEDIESFRQWGSLTPGHPEYGHTKGVEATTGPLGQGIAMAVGMAMAQKRLAAHFNRDSFPVFNNFTYALAGDGCMMEGVASEAASLAGTLGLGKLIVLYDSNNITIEGNTDVAFRENVLKRYDAYGWQVISVDDGENVDAITVALSEAKRENAKPTLIIVKTKIAHGTLKEGKASAHGSPLGEEAIAKMREDLGYSYPPFTIPDEVKAHFAELAEECARPHKEYDIMLDGYKKAYPELYKELLAWQRGELSNEAEALLRSYTLDAPKATRSVSGDILNKLYPLIPELFGGSADLCSSNMTELKGQPFFSAETPDAPNIHFGIREFAMACACNGMALYGGLRPYCATFLVFSDYLKPALRLSALMKLPVLYILTHDSIGVGEDGPTHQPIEHVAALRATPGVNVYRPADAKECAFAYLSALKAQRPSALALSRQNLPQLEGTGEGALRGGYILREPKGEPDVILMASGSEVELIYKAADMLSVQGFTARLVSMPCMELFDEQDESYRESVLPKAMRKRVAVEAATSFGWHKYTGLDGAVVSHDGFGASAPAGKLFGEYGFTAENVAKAALKVIKG